MKKNALLVFALLICAGIAGVYLFPGGRNAGTVRQAATVAGRGVYRRLYSAEVTTLNYLHTGNTNDLKVAANVIDCLVEYDNLGMVKPALAVSWSHDDDFLKWTFKLREGVKWVDKDGKEVANVTAHDWVTAAAYVNNALNDSGLQYMFDGIISKAQDYYEQTVLVMEAQEAVNEGKAGTVEEYFAANGIDQSAFITFSEVGVKALDDYTLEYTMESPCPFFLSVLSYASYMPVYGPFIKECGDAFGLDKDKLLYNGAYVLSEYEPQKQRVMTANPLYWDKEKVFINRLEYIYNARDISLAPTMFVRGEVDYAEIGADILDEWIKNPETKDLVRPSPVDRSYSYFYLFNFEPRFDKAYEPDNWLLAVNNEKFRKSLMLGLDVLKALAVTDPYTPESLRNHTITPRNFTAAGGRDYTDFEPLAGAAIKNDFNPDQALVFKNEAVKELKAVGCTLPVKVLMMYNPAIFNWDKECQVVAQQLETLLGKDYINIIIEAGPSTGFLSEIRRTGKYAFMKCNWGADYADPQTWTDSFNAGNSYNFMYTDEKKILSGVPAINKSESTQAVVAEYYRLLNRAKGLTKDVFARYQAFVNAEAYFIEHALGVPFSVDTTGYVAERLDPFDVQYSAFGVTLHRFKGRKLLEKPMNMEEYASAYAKWEEDRAKAVQSAK